MRTHLLLISLAVALLWPAPGTAQVPIEPTARPTLPAPPGTRPPLPRRPDLTCSIEVRSVATNQEVQNGHTVPHGDYRATVRVTQSGAPASHGIALTFNWGTTTGTVWDWKWSPARRAEILSLRPGETAAATDFVLNTSCARMCSVRIGAEVDADREVTESDETNNTCTFQFLGLVF